MRNGDAKQVISFDGFELDAERRRLTREGKPLHLNAKAFDLLVYLAKNAGRVVTKDEILDAVWQDQFVEEGNLKVQMSALRKVLGEQRDDHRLLVTIPGKGYKFVADIRNGDHEIVIESHRFSRVVVDEEISESAPAAREFLPGHKAATRTRLYFAAAAFLLLSLVAGGIFWFSGRNQNASAYAPSEPNENEVEIRRLTNKGKVSVAVLSPDAKFFAYSLRERGSYQDSLWLGQTNGSSDVQLRPVTDVIYVPRSFSADGSWLYYTSTKPRAFDNGTLYKMQVLGGVPQSLLKGVNIYAVVSPDEKHVAYIRGSREKKTESLVIAGLDGSVEREIATRPAGAQSFSRSSLSWSPDGTSIAFGAKVGVGETEEVFTATVTDGTVKQITALEWLEIARVEWQAGGRGFVAVARDKNSPAATQLWQIDHDSGKARRITRDLNRYGSPLSLSKDSSSLIAIQLTTESSIWIADAQNLAAARQVTFGSTGHEGWFGIDSTTDGKIVYTARVGQSSVLWTMNADGGNPIQITSAGFVDRRPSVTPDGRYVVFQSDRSGSTEIWRVNFDGGDLRQLTFDSKSSVPHAGPDGRTVVFTRSTDGISSAWRVPIDGGEATRITETQCSNARVSPDGSFIACGYSTDGKTRLAIVSMNGGAPVKSFDVPSTSNFDGSIRWTSDGRSIAYRDWVNGVWQQSLDGGEPVRLAGLPAEKLLHFEWLAGGKQFAYARGRESRDVVMISNTRSF